MSLGYTTAIHQSFESLMRGSQKGVMDPSRHVSRSELIRD